MTNPMTLAIGYLDQAEEWQDKIGTTQYNIDDEQFSLNYDNCLKMAERCAAVASAAALTRIADALEHMETDGINIIKI